MQVSGIQLVLLASRWGIYYEYSDFDQIVTHFFLSFFCKLDNNPHQRDRVKRIHKQNECDCRAIQARNMARYWVHLIVKINVIVIDANVSQLSILTKKYREAQYVYALNR